MGGAAPAEKASIVVSGPAWLVAARQTGAHLALGAMLDANPLVVEGPHGLHLLMDDGQGSGHDGWLF
jgi:hypothetical protein